MRRTLQLAAIGTAAGAFSGLFGVGGGTIIVPLLIVWLAYGEREATGTSMAAIIDHRRPSRPPSRPAYGNVDPSATRRWSASRRSAGAIAGTALQQRLPERAISVLFAAAAGRDRGGADRPVSEVAAAILGFLGGVVGGLLGVGGGILFVPALTIFLDEPQVEAEATSLLAIVPVAIVATWRQRELRERPPRRGLLIGALSPLGVAIGVSWRTRSASGCSSSPSPGSRC